MSLSEIRTAELSPELFPASRRVLDEGLADGVAPGFVAGVWRLADPSRMFIGALGNRCQQGAPLPMMPNTVFDLASITKIFSTASLAALLVERRWLKWETPLRALLPDYPFSGMQLRHLLSHTAGLPAWEPLWQKMRDRFAPRLLHTISIVERQREMRELVFAVAPDAPLETRALYSDLSFLLLGFALEEAVQLPLDRAVRELLWSPLGLKESYYVRVDRSVEKGRDQSVAATEICPWRGALIQGQVHDDNCWAMGGYAGHAGAFATAGELLRFSAALLQGFFSRDTLKKMWSRVENPDGCSRTLGWDTPSGESPSFGKRFSPYSVGHLGFTGTSLWIDPVEGVAVTLLSNRVHPSRDNQKIKAFRPKFHEAAWQDLRALPKERAKL